MSSNDSTQPSDEGRTVATDADQSPPSTGADTNGAAEGSNGSNGRSAGTPSPSPSPSPRTSSGEAGSSDREVPSPRAEGTSGDGAAPASPAQSGAKPWGSADAVPEAGAQPESQAPSQAQQQPEAPVPSPSAQTQSITPVVSSEQASAASGPPPWRRVPGDHPAEPEPEEAERPSVADSLLSEAPTAFLTAAGAGAAGAAATATATRDRDDAAPVAQDEPDRPAPRNRPPRQALLQLKRLDPWSVLKMALALAIVLFLVWMVAAGVLYGVLGGMGVWDRLNGTYADLVTGQTQNAGSLISAGRVFLLAAVVGAINSLLFAVALTIVAFVYNVAADLVGGIEVTLSERD